MSVALADAVLPPATATRPPTLPAASAAYGGAASGEAPLEMTADNPTHVATTEEAVLCAVEALIVLHARAADVSARASPVTTPATCAFED